MESQQQPQLVSPKNLSEEPTEKSHHVVMTAAQSKYSKRVIIKSILERSGGNMELVGQRVVIGGWIKSSKEVKKEPVPVSPPRVFRDESSHRDVNCNEIFQTRVPFFKSIMKVFGCPANFPIRQKLEAAKPVIFRPPPPSTMFLIVSDGSCVDSLQVLVESSLASPSDIMPTGTCILVEGELRVPLLQGKHTIELKADKILHLGTVEQDKYPLAKKRLPLEYLRDCPHFRARTTTVASVMRIRSALAFASHTFFQNHEFLHVQVPVITTTDSDGFSEKFHVTTLSTKAGKLVNSTASKDTEGFGLDVVKSAIKEKTSLVEKLKRSDSNQEALTVAMQDLRKTNELASQLEAKQKLKQQSSLVKSNTGKVYEDFFSSQASLSVSSRLHLESYACAFGNVYSFGPRFHADRTVSTKQAAEMWTVDTEMAFSQLEDAISCAEDYFKFLCKWVLESCSEDMNFVCKRIDKASISRLQSMMSSSFERISYTEAVDALNKTAKKISDTKLEWGIALTTEHLSYLADEIYKTPLIVCNYPKETKPLYVRLNADGKTVAAFDMVLPKVGSLIIGSQNEERINVLEKRIDEAGLSREQYEWYCELHRQGIAKCSGFSFGFDLMVLFITGLVDARDVIPFPRSFGNLKN